jgi:catechol 2,3-dioxygenase-like lactoylglutathione lyase family enzyme
MPGDEQTAVSLKLLVVKTRHLEEVRAFYQSLGVALASERHGQGPLHHAGQIGEAVFEVYPQQGDDAPDVTTRLGFAVDDLGRVLETLQAAGTPVIRQAKTTAWGTQAVVRDPDGRAVELYQREARP